jgi:hypothetical protein
MQGLPVATLYSSQNLIVGPRDEGFSTNYKRLTRKFAS